MVCEGKDTVGITIQNIKISLELCIVDLVTIDPEFERTGYIILPNLFQKLGDYRHIIVDHDNIWLLLSNNLR